MKNKKDILTDKQFQINQRSAADTQTANEWLEQTGFNTNTFGTTHIRLLQAQQQAHALLTHHSNLLTHSQRTALENFQKLMAHKHTRNRLKPTAANPILNISSKINRQLFRQHRQLTQASH
jgi:acetylornithine/succinyldiaminopimelate/putrescine aminotransferase